MSKALTITLIIVSITSSLSIAGQIGYVEDFALAKDRAEALKQLIPGTDEYYYYHCLHYQNTGQKAQFSKTLKLWLDKHKGHRTSQMYMLENRRALLQYKTDPQGTLRYLTNRMHLLFNHRRQTAQTTTNLKSKLNEGLITRAALTARAYAHNGDSLGGFENRAIDWLIATSLNERRRHYLLARLQRPDYPNLVQLVIDDLSTKRYSKSFGSQKIHGNMLLTQLDECIRLKPDLLNQSRFVYAYLAKLRPGVDTDWRHDAKAREAYLDRLWSFVSRLTPAFNSLKAHVLHHRLVHDRAAGKYDADRFMTYIKLPRSASYANYKYYNSEINRRYRINLGSNFYAQTLLPTVGNDEPLIRSYLMHYFVKADSYDTYSTYLRDSYLKHVFAETKIVNRIGDDEKWQKMLSPSQIKALKERIDLDFVYTNKIFFAPEDKVTLGMKIKNVKTLIVKVYQVNTDNYYRKYGKQVTTDINLDGLVANEERVIKYDNSPFHREARQFTFDKLTGPGVWVIDFIGNGRNSRLLVRKGKLRFLVRTSVAGQVFTILDAANRKLSGAKILLGGLEYLADEDGLINIPFSNSPRRQKIIIAHKGFTSLDEFNHLSENYQLTAGIYVDREALLQQKKASVIVRPMLRVNGVPVTLSILEDIALTVTTIDQDGVASTKKFKDYKLFEDRETVTEFRVAENLRRISFALTAKVANKSQAKKNNLGAAASFSLNGIDASEKVQDLHLMTASGKYILEVRGKTAERKMDQPVYLTIKHRDFKQAVNVTLKTDDAGRIQLGSLPEITYITARGPAGVRHTWRFPGDRHTQADIVHGQAGQPLYLPYMGKASSASADEVSLLQIRGATYLSDRRAAASIKNGMLIIQDLPAGDYDLLLKDSGQRVKISLTEGRVAQGYVLGDLRQLQVINPKPLQIVSTNVGKKEITVQLANAGKYTRVHVLGARYMPEYPLYSQLTRVGYVNPGRMTLSKLDSLYLTGRNIGDEYRYIIDRKYAVKFPGNMLKRPELLLNPWAIRKTDAGVQRAAGGGKFDSKGRGPGTGFGGTGAASKTALRAGNFSNLNFLAAASSVILNIQPDDNGVVTIPIDALAGKQHIRIAAVDPENTVYRELSLAETKPKFNRQDLVIALDSTKHFAEQKRITPLLKGADFVLADIATSPMELYDTLGKVYGLQVTLSGNSTLRKFGFILGWPELKDEKKRELYSKYACHELNYFLMRKDPDFFTKTIQPYLRNKKDKTFMDHWLTGDDVGAYLKPWAFAQLNTVERILLAQRIRAEYAHTARHVGDMFDLLPPNIERFNHLFRTALKGSSLETGDALGLIAAGEKAAESRRADYSRRLRSSSGRGGAEMEMIMADSPAGPTKRPTTPPGAAPRPSIASKLKKSIARKPSGKLGRAEGNAGYYAKDSKKRQQARQFYRKLDKTMEWAENNYYHLPIESQNASLITVNAFWRDYAKHDAGSGAKKSFISKNFAEATRNFPEMMFALAVLDIPFESGKHETKHGDSGRLDLKAASNMVIFHKEIEEAKSSDGPKVPILVSQNFYRYGERYKHVNGEKLDKYVTEEFLRYVVYGCHVVVTNPTSSRQKLDILLQIPSGAIPVLNGKKTRSLHVDLQPYRTQTTDYFFYFPATGKFPQFPVHVARHGQLITSAKAPTLNVVAKLTKIDKTSWAWISQNGSSEDVVAFLKDNNIGRISLELIAWRMKDKDFFQKITALLAMRHVYHHTLWSYGIKHDEVSVIREYLQHSNSFLNQCGPYIVSELVTIDPVVRNYYQHLEYSPLVNARAHRLSQRRNILNDRFGQQYHRLMNILTYRPKLDNVDKMAVTYYMLLQDRIEEAQGFFKAVDPKKLTTALQYDYFTAYMDFFNEKPTVARAIVKKYANHGVDRWRKLFAAVAAQLDELEGKNVKVIDNKDRTQTQTQLAASQPGFELKIIDDKVTLNYQNITECTVNYYPMDIELLFSRNPFVQTHGGQFSLIRPNMTAKIALPKVGDGKLGKHSFTLPEQYATKNVMVEVVAAGLSKSDAYFANSMTVQVISNYGQVKVANAKTGKPLPKVYVKVYARMKNGQIRFYKDGYTDLRGRFDYTSLNTNELDQVAKFSILILSEDSKGTKGYGAVVRETTPPKR
jgi:hypothetical protein